MKNKRTNSLATKLMDSKFNFVKNMKWFIILPIAILLAGIVVLCVCGFNLGLDFTGGTILEIDTHTTITDKAVYNAQVGTIEDVFKQHNLKISSVQKQGTGAEQTIVVRFQDINGKTETEMGEIVEQIKEDIKSSFIAKEGLEVDFKSSERISASASSALLWKAVLAISVAIVLMLIYIIIRFEFFSGLCAFIALVHDVLIMLCLTAICRITVNSAFIAAIITIIGYSINDTIVVFDRIRELSRKDAYINKPFEHTVDHAIKQTMQRTINTSLTTIMAVFLLAILGVSTIKEFVIPIIFGLFAGTYSSVFIAGPLFAKIADKKGITFKVKQLKMNKENTK